MIPLPLATLVGQSFRLGASGGPLRFEQVCGDSDALSVARIEPFGLRLDSSGGSPGVVDRQQSEEKPDSYERDRTLTY
jgi:hypothetical protein